MEGRIQYPECKPVQRWACWAPPTWVHPHVSDIDQHEKLQTCCRPYLRNLLFRPHSRTQLIHGSTPFLAAQRSASETRPARRCVRRGGPSFALPTRINVTFHSLQSPTAAHACGESGVVLPGSAAEPLLQLLLEQEVALWCTPTLPSLHNAGPGFCRSTVGVYQFIAALDSYAAFPVAVRGQRACGGAHRRFVPPQP